MAGHNKWSQIKRKKAANDAQRGKIISKHIRAIQQAVRQGDSGDPAVNTALKNAIAAAKSDNVPQDNIDRGVERALGGAEGAGFDEVVYEGYGPAGVALLIEGLTDNRNRTIADVRHVFSKHGGNMSGSTAWQFESRGIIVIASCDDALEDLAIELGALDIESDEESTTIYTEPTELYQIAEGFSQAGYESEVCQLSKIPQNPSSLSLDDAEKVQRMVDALEDLDDVQNVYSTADFSVLAEVA